MYELRLAAKSRSLARIGFISVKDYVVGQKYKVWYEVENIGKNIFPEGILQILINWPNGQFVGQRFRIKKLSPGEVHRTKIRITHALARGFALFFAGQIDSDDSKKVEMFSAPGRKLQPPRPRAKSYHIYSIYAKPKEEIVGYWALWSTIVSLAILIVTTVIQFIIWGTQR